MDGSPETTRGNGTGVTAVKTEPMASFTCDILYGEDVCEVGELADPAVKAGLLASDLLASVDAEIELARLNAGRVRACFVAGFRSFGFGLRLAGLGRHCKGERQSGNRNCHDEFANHLEAPIWLESHNLVDA